MRLTGFTMLTLGVAACSQSNAPSAPVSSRAASAAAIVSVAPVESTTPTPAGVPEERLRLTEVAALPEVPEHGSVGALFAIDDALLLTVDAPGEHGAKIFSVSRSGKLEEMPRLFVDQIEATVLNVHHVEGTLGARLDVLTTEHGGPIPACHHRRAVGAGGWKEHQQCGGHVPVGVVSRNGATIALLNHYMATVSGQPPIWLALSGKDPKLMVTKPSCPGKNLGSLLVHEAIAASPRGHGRRVWEALRLSASGRDLAARCDAVDGHGPARSSRGERVH